jgi:hypothetical protein
MPSGGPQPGSGRPRTRPLPEGGTAATRKPAKSTATPPKTVPGTTDPDAFFRMVLNDPTQSMADRMRSALALHGKTAGPLAKPEEPGKKQQAQARAEEVAAGASPYRPRTPPVMRRVS